MQQAGFQTVGGLERQSRIEPYREGGVNDHERQHVTLTTYPPLVLKRGLVDTGLWDWHQDVIEGRVERRTVSVVLIGEDNQEVWRYLCEGAFPSKWTGADLDAAASGIATESLELVHHGLKKQ